MITKRVASAGSLRFALFCGIFYKIASLVNTLEGYQNSCYNQYFQPQPCQPRFHNIAYGQVVQASHTCGTIPRKFCTSFMGQKTCGVCDGRVARLAHPARYLTDLHNENNITCWQADPVQSLDNISLTLSFGKSFDITYISLQFCSIRPNSMAIYKSLDFRKTWRPYQFYSSDCRGMYGRSNKGIVSRKNEQEALCTNAHLIKPLQGGRIDFTTLEGRPSRAKLDYSHVLQEWITATDIKIVFNRIGPTSTLQPQETQYYAVSDLAVGGRCHCNGHASRCIADREGYPLCDCKHNTAGPDCGRCKPFFNDRPWRPATENFANECVACNCNLHARVCEFNMELFKLSGGKSGGVCRNCRHNTAGRHCHYCREGYYKDPSKDITHRRVCKPCNCHPSGSMGKVCDQLTGQCPCKKGVTGLTCYKCARGYQQSKSSIAPCIKRPQEEIQGIDPPPRRRSSGCSSCKKITLTARRLCRKNYAIRATVVALDKSLHKNWVQLTVNVNRPFKRSSLRLRRGDYFVWMRLKDYKCKCPKIKVGLSYFIAGSILKQRNLWVLRVDRKSIVIPWQERLVKKISKYLRRERKKKCNKRH